MVAVVSLAALYALKHIERRALERLKRGRVRFVIDMDAQLRLAELTAILDRAGGRVLSMKVMGDEDEDERELVVVTQLPSRVVVEDLARDIRALEGVADVDVDL